MLDHFADGDRANLKGKKILDAGCGAGKYALVWMDNFKHVHCSDFNHGMLEQTGNLLKEKKIAEDKDKPASSARSLGPTISSMMPFHARITCLKLRT